MINFKSCSGVFMIVFLAAALLLASFAIWETGGRVFRPQTDSLLNGRWAESYEKTFDRHFPMHKPAEALWGLANFLLFREGREGVLVGEDGQLFTAEEFEVPPAARQNMEANIAFIAHVREKLEARGIRLAVALLPAKARLYEDRLGRYALPATRKEIYGRAVQALRARGIATADILTAMRNSPEQDSLFLRTDTHWAPAGAALAARTVAYTIQESFPDLTLPETVFETKKTGSAPHRGDLLRYLPLGAWQNRLGLPSDLLPVMVTKEKLDPKPDAANLFGDITIPIALVGTSYSANRLWHFEGFLKEALQADVLNAADEGRGPFETMERYLKDRAFETAPPALIIWEIPERYLPVPYTLPDEE